MTKDDIEAYIRSTGAMYYDKLNPGQITALEDKLTRCGLPAGEDGVKLALGMEMHEILGERVKSGSQPALGATTAQWAVINGIIGALKMSSEDPAKEPKALEHAKFNKPLPEMQFVEIAKSLEQLLKVKDKLKAAGVDLEKLPQSQEGHGLLFMDNLSALFTIGDDESVTIDPKYFQWLNKLDTGAILTVHDQSDDYWDELFSTVAKEASSSEMGEDFTPGATSGAAT